MRRWTLPPPVKLLLVVILAALLASVIDPYLGIGSRLAAQGVNAVLPVVLVLLLWGLSGRAWLALVLEAAVLGLLWYADHTKMMYLKASVVYADLTVIGGLLQDPGLVLGFIRPSAGKIAGVVAVLVAAALVAWFTRRRPADSWRLRVACLVLAAAGMVAVWTVRVPNVLPSLHWQVFQQSDGARFVGVAGNLLLGRLTSRDIAHQPDDRAIQAFWNEPAVRRARQQLATDGSDLHPDIVVIQSESLFEPSQLCGFADTPVLKHVARQQPRLAGNLHVPVFGGRTLQTEFEVLTGTPVAFYPSSGYAYYDVLDHRVDALPHVLDRLGYKTIAMHPNSRGFWRRDSAMPDMGFSTFEDIGSFIYPRDYSDRGHVSDAALTRAILAELDAADRPTFITAITMDNHGPWGRAAPKNDAGLGLPDKLAGRGRTQMADYVAHAIDSDNAYGFLLDALARRGRPTIVLFYGDHLPALSAVYSQLCFKDGKRPRDHLPPYRVWANFAVPPPPDVSWAYLLQGWLMRAARLPLAGHELANALAGMVAHDPATTDPERARVLGEYAHIAAANIAARVPDDGGSTVFIGYGHALDVLMKAESQRQAAGGLAVRYKDLFLQPKASEPAQIRFAARNAIASMTLRPYLGAPTAQCLGDPKASRAVFAVEGDGRVLYRAELTPRSLRLVSLDLRGVQQLTLRAEPANGSGHCDWVQVRVAQMRCYSAACDRPGPAPPAAVAARQSRLLQHDPMPGDLAALPSMTPLHLKSVDAKRDHLHWLIGRETGRQTGHGPFKVDRYAQLFMHPGNNRHAWIEFDVTGVNKLVFSPRINRLDSKCAAMNQPGREAGVVGLTVSLDGKPIVPRMIVDRHYAKALPLTVEGGHTLRVEVDKGNAVAWCDWFSIGAPRLQGPAVDGMPAAASHAASEGPL